MTRLNGDEAMSSAVIPIIGETAVFSADGKIDYVQLAQSRLDEIERLRAALKALVENIDAGVSAEVFKNSERSFPEGSALHFARAALSHQQQAARPTKEEAEERKLP